MGRLHGRRTGRTARGGTTNSTDHPRPMDPDHRSRSRTSAAARSPDDTAPPSLHARGRPGPRARSRAGSASAAAAAARPTTGRRGLGDGDARGPDFVLLHRRLGHARWRRRQPVVSRPRRRYRRDDRRCSRAAPALETPCNRLVRLLIDACPAFHRTRERSLHAKRKHRFGIARPRHAETSFTCALAWAALRSRRKTPRLVDRRPAQIFVRMCSRSGLKRVAAWGKPAGVSSARSHRLREDRAEDRDPDHCRHADGCPLRDRR
jgi:hypothetical protein